MLLAEALLLHQLAAELTRVGVVGAGGRRPRIALGGRVVAGDGKCVTNDASCRAASMCKSNGHCTAKDNDCIATSDADCGASLVCNNGDGRCAAKDGKCVTNDAGCRAALVCKSSGRCTAKDDGWRRHLRRGL